MFKYKENRKESLNGGVAYRFFFENGYGASVIKHSGSYGNERDLWELAVLTGNKNNWELSYNTQITDDVIGYLSIAEVNELLDKIKELPKEN